MKKIYSLAALLLLISFASYSQTNNYLTNGNFENDFRDWTYGAANGSAMNFTIETAAPISGAKSAKIQITAKGVNPWDAFLDNKLTLHKDKPMKLSFKAKASAATIINFELAQNYPDYLGLVRHNNVAVGTNVATYEYTFTPTFSDGNMKVAFLLGNIDPGVTIWIDDVVVEEVGSQWNGNIIPNGEFNEFTTPTAAENFPPFRRKKLSFSTDAVANGGWEGGWREDGTDINFDVDQTGKLSGPNAAHIQVINKPNTNFFNGAFTVFFQASQGVEYDLSFDVIASQNVTFRVAMNRQPFEVAGEYPLQPDRFSIPVEATTTKKTITVKSLPLTDSRMHQIFFAGLPQGGPYDIWIDNVQLKKAGTPTSSAKELQQGKLMVYPNPTADGTIHLDVTGLGLQKQFRVSVFSLTGSKLQDQEFTNTTTATISTRLSKGLYLVKVQDGQKSYTQKVVVSQ